MRFPLAILSLCLLATGGCAYFGIIADRAKPPEMRDAAYELAVQPTAVVINRNEAEMGAALALRADPMAIILRERLQDKTEVPIDQQSPAQTIELKLVPTGAGESAGTFSNVHVGVAVAARVRVVDASGNEIWPLDTTDGKLVVAELPPTRSRSETDPAAHIRRLYTLLGERVAMLFYRHPIGA